MDNKLPRLIIFTSLFPNSVQPNAGVFIRERMFRVGEKCPIVVVSPIPWFPFQKLINVFKPGFRPQPNKFEEQQGIKVFHPRFFSFPGVLKNLDGFFMAIGSYLTLYKIRQFHHFDLIDAHFAYPDGYAAALLGRWFGVPVTITLRGTEVPLSKMPGRKKRMLLALKYAANIFSVSNSLKKHVTAMGAQAEKIQVIGNGVDTDKFYPIDKKTARNKIGIAEDAKVLISVGGLVERKGFHRVIEILPELIKQFPNLIFLIVGGASSEGNNKALLQKMVEELELEQHVKFLGALPSEQLKIPLSASDIFVLATANEGWANVFLEAMACGLPVVTTDVGGNQEVVCNDALGTIVQFGQKEALLEAISHALVKDWDKNKIINYALVNAWDTRVTKLTKAFSKLIRKNNED